MPKPNRFEVSKARGFEALHGKGVSTTCYTLTGTTVAKDIFGTVTGFDGTITGILMNTRGATAATVTLTKTGTTVCTLTGASSLGGVVGCTTLTAAQASLTKTGTLRIASGSASDVSQVFITYKVT